MIPADALSAAMLTGMVGTALIGAGMWALRSLPMRLWHLLVRQYTIVAEVTNADDAYDWVVSWLAAHPYARTARNLALSTAGAGGCVDAPTPPTVHRGMSLGNRQGPTIVISPGMGMHLLWYRGRPVLLRRNRGDGPSQQHSMRRQESITLQVLGRDRALLIDLLADVARVAAPREAETRIYANSYENWYTAARKQRRPLDSVVLAPGMVDSLVADIGWFLANGSWYAERGIPYRRGYGLYGPPGSGKTSLIAALGGHFEIDICMLSLASVPDDQQLLRLFQTAPSRLILIEDIDAVFASERKLEGDAASRLTFSGLLNAIDGIAATDGRILFVSSNHRDRLDPALIRPGRIDVDVTFGHATQDQATTMFRRFFPDRADAAERFGSLMPEGRLSTAWVQALLTKHAQDPDAAIAEMEASSS
jgi:chaperone BCS1